MRPRVKAQLRRSNNRTQPIQTGVGLDLLPDLRIRQRMISFLFRIVLLLIAISAIKSAVNFGKRLWYTSLSGRASVRAHHAGEVPAAELQKDPVCGIYVPVETSLKRIAGGHVWHFCSEECRNRFRV